MPAFAAISINDGQATPVAHTFNPTEIVDGQAVLHDRSGGIAIGYLKLGVSLKLPKSAGNGQGSDANTRVIRTKVTVDLPTLETLATGSSGYEPPPTVSYVCRGICEFIFPERCSAQNRKDARAFIANALAHADVKKVVEDLENIY